MSSDNIKKEEVKSADAPVVSFDWKPLRGIAMVPEDEEPEKATEAKDEPKQEVTEVVVKEEENKPAIVEPEVNGKPAVDSAIVDEAIVVATSL